VSDDSVDERDADGGQGDDDHGERHTTRAGIDTRPDDVDATICFLQRSRDGREEVLLIWKKRGVGSQQYNGPGGKVEAGESPREAAVREVREEVGVAVDPGSLAYAGDLHFVFDHDPFMDVRVYRSRSFSGEPTETPEADPEWLPVADVPYEQMWDDDRFWLPHVLAGRAVAGRFYFSDGGDSLETFALDVFTV
jgi:8-oxo-dGTP diphosphatase